MARKYRLGVTRKAANVVVTALLARGIPVTGGTGFLLTTRGRRSGVDRTTPVNVLEVDGERWLVSPYGQVGWVHNLRADPAARLRRGRTRETWEVEEADAATAGPVLRAYVRKIPVTAPFFDAKLSDPAETFAAEADRHPVFRLARSRA
ncbi:deazaflavin-dependent oxidoreductase (nitroreductase family) [Amycolatopsis lexingtonensis]|uniref:Deazaflavin-dependent oxidoreductase (Nitroreductase family) n=1 Tax=Amycolatopsis lexingtonensis TaxID=218822 RepID=A0ABR9I4G6_9PSEU|nr:nitroreductase family deazaflavin-dependent oxidoreductase [Amycolatopsis lexingtonensis]MBE1498066.1 deazaflavin-dependent oxidoreductase (nitroreductase family) [Amycolatopsis lexingtonensis]